MYKCVPISRFKNEWAQRYDSSKFRVNVVSGKIPTFIYYDAAGTELERVALDEKTAEELSEVCSLGFPACRCHMKFEWLGTRQMLAAHGIHPTDGSGGNNIDDSSRGL